MEDAPPRSVGLGKVKRRVESTISSRRDVAVQMVATTKGLPIGNIPQADFGRRDPERYLPVSLRP
jgi:hypothetical protein